MLRTLLSACFLTLLGCDPGADAGSQQEWVPSPFLYVWAGAENEQESDFLAVIDADPASSTYAEVLASVPVGLRGGAHHSEHIMPSGDSLFVNSFRAGTQLRDRSLGADRTQSGELFWCDRRVHVPAHF